MQKTNPKSYKQDQKEGLKGYADMTIYALDLARLVTSLTLSNFCYIILFRD